MENHMDLPRKPLALLIATTLAVPAAVARAQEAQEEEGGHPSLIEEVVITSSRVPTSLRQIGTSVSVMTEFEIESHGNLGLTDILRQMPAVATSSNGGQGKSTSLRIRGEEGFRTLTIFDGMRLSDPASPQIGPQLEHLLSSGIGRVEVLRGPQGLSYGADAGGVLNISSRSTKNGLAGNVDMQGGRYGTRQLSGNLGGGNERADFFVSLADFKTDGFNTRTDDTELPDDDGYENTTFHGRLGVNLNERWRAEFVHRRTDGDSLHDGCFLEGTIHDCRGAYDMEASRAALQYESDAFTHSLSYARTDTLRENFARGVSYYTADGELERWEYVGSARELPGFDLVFGSDFELAGFNGSERENLGYYLEALSDFSDNLFFTAGARYDDNEDFGTNTSYRFSAAYLFEFDNGGTLKLKSSYGTGFRAPSPYEVAYNTSPDAYPPASLVKLAQEKSRGVEAGIEYFTKSLHLEAVYFDQEVRDAIYFDLADYSGYLQDLGVSDSRGVELNAQMGLGESWAVNFNYTYNETKRPNGLPRQRRPKNLLNAGLSWYGLDHKLAVHGFYRISRNSYDGSGDVMFKLDDFEVLDLSLNYSVNDKLTVYGRVENALDERYYEIRGYNTAHAAAYVGVRLAFSR